MFAYQFISFICILGTLLDVVFAATSLLGRKSPTLYVAGDSTAARDDGNPALLGWGEKIGQYISIPVVNDAVSGATTRTYTEQGYFAEIVDAVQPRDLVIIEFGHNDNRSLADNPTTGDCPGADLTTTCNINGTIVYTYNKYMQDAITSLKQKHALVIISSQTPDNPYAITTNPVFVSYAAELAHTNHLSYIDHFHLLLKEYEALGENATNALFPLDQYVHTSPEGADIAAQAIIRGALCDSGNPLFPFVTNTSVAPRQR
ncbi:SGNH hydrolase [Fomitiporia mediterranea MF3/22]|uniref:SGNH hydrolase n=1 Tax=Fomitiporia mediterranea (strain MF3/22) TaxID=694068 RepID=UPI00044091B0|nr:SGNH hydrolase [Fomitiporia mediterranea MF3/22]EJC98170.1 SGNH hydrolase [Fomitiporia mediterranea MF3/22]